jgi:hypothetical protein
VGDFLKAIGQSAIAGAVSGAVTGLVLGNFNTRFDSEEQKQAYLDQYRLEHGAAIDMESFTGKLSPTNVPVGWRLVGATITSLEQAGSALVRWDDAFFKGTVQNATAGTGFDFSAGIFVDALLINTF